MRTGRLVVALAVAACLADVAMTRGDERGPDGGVTLTRTPIDGLPWPELTARRYVRARPAEVMAVYMDLERQSVWVPGLVTSRIAARPAPHVLHVTYEYEVLGPNERYTVELSLRSSRTVLEARWHLLDARYARRLSGAIRVEPAGEATLVTYTSRVDPGPVGATLGSPESVARSLGATLNALAHRVDHLTTHAPEEVARLIATLRASLASE
jgi:hypothetical protein